MGLKTAMAAILADGNSNENRKAMNISVYCG